MSFLDTSINPDGSAGTPPLSQADFADKASWTAAVQARQAFSPVMQSSVAYSTSDLMSGKAAMTTRKFAATQGGQDYAALSDYGLKAGFWTPRKDDFTDKLTQTVVEGVVVAGIGAGAAGMVGYGPAAVGPSTSVDSSAAITETATPPPSAWDYSAPPSSSGLALDSTGLSTVLKGGTAALGLFSSAKGLGLFGSKTTGFPGSTLAPGEVPGSGTLTTSSAPAAAAAPQSVYLIVAAAIVGAVLLLT
jgi:hypothetical protein